VAVSPSVPSIGCRPVSTLIPGRIPCCFNTSTNGTPARDDWNNVSSNMMVPLMYCHPKERRKDPKEVTQMSMDFNNPVAIKRKKRIHNQENFFPISSLVNFCNSKLICLNYTCVQLLLLLVRKD